MAGEKDLNMLSPTSLLVNTSRAALIDEMALISLRQSRKIRGAALDVHEPEPLPQDSVCRTTRWGTDGSSEVI